MKLIIYSSNFEPELTGIGKYNGEMASKFVELGVDTHVVTAPPYYPEWRIHDTYKNGWSKQVLDNGVTVHRSPIYVPRSMSFLKRLLHLMSFALSSVPNLFKMVFSRPDVVMVVQPSLFCAPAALLFCAVTGARSVMHVQDFELEAMLGSGMSGGRKRWSIFRKFETFLMRRFDLVSSISYSMLEKAKSKGVDEDRLIHFPNWVDTSAINPSRSGDALRQRWGINPDDKVILYAGNLGNKQGLEIVLDAAEALIGEPAYKFLIVGSGTSEKRLKESAAARNLTNVEFKPLQPLEVLPEMLAMADVHLVVQKRGVADAVLPSKLTSILSIGGHALITAEPQTELGQIAKRHKGIFTMVEPEHPEAFTKALIACANADTRTPNPVARKFALDYLNIHSVINKYLEDIQLRIAKGLIYEKASRKHDE